MGIGIAVLIDAHKTLYLVPEGQHDRSQARSAWSHEEKGQLGLTPETRAHASCAEGCNVQGGLA
jgi:hypothetical protein